MQGVSERKNEAYTCKYVELLNERNTRIASGPRMRPEGAGQRPGQHSKQAAH